MAKITHALIILIVLCICWLSSNASSFRYDIPFRKVSVYVPKECHHKTKRGDILNITFSITFLNGTLYKNGFDPRTKATLQLGTYKDITGLEKGLRDMCEKEIRNLTLPSSCRYKVYGVETDIDLIYSVKLQKIIKPTKETNSFFTTEYFKAIDTDKDEQLHINELTTFLGQPYLLSNYTTEEEKYLMDAQRKLARYTARLILEESDKDSNGLLSHSEFVVDPI